jgi:Recombination endonuclease VII
MNHVCTEACERYKDGRCKAKVRAHVAKYRASPEGKASRAAYKASPEGKASRAAYKASPKGRARQAAYGAEYRARPEVKLSNILHRSKSVAKKYGYEPLDPATLPADLHLITKCQHPTCKYEYNGSNNQLHKDHCHKTGRFVAMLCSKHNTRIEGLRDPGLVHLISDEEWDAMCAERADYQFRERARLRGAPLPPRSGS